MIRVAVIGAGDLARQHARAFEAIPHACSFAGLFDPASPDGALGEADALVVASDPDLRFHHTALALEHGLDVLVEQPAAPTVENVRMLERIASLRPTAPVVQVSAPDHFNPALRKVADTPAPIAIDFRRLLPTDVGMLHDVHTLVSLARSPLVRLMASGGDRYAVATLVFESGLVGTLATGPASAGPVHEIVVTSADALLAVDLIAGTAELARGDVRERTRVPVGDPFAAQAESFVRAVRERGKPEVGLRAAAACMEVADGVRECLAVQAAATGTGGVPAH